MVLTWVIHQNPLRPSPRGQSPATPYYLAHLQQETTNLRKHLRASHELVGRKALKKVLVIGGRVRWGSTILITSVPTPSPCAQGPSRAPLRQLSLPTLPHFCLPSTSTYARCLMIPKHTTLANPFAFPNAIPCLQNPCLPSKFSSCALRAARDLHLAEHPSPLRLLHPPLKQNSSLPPQGAPHQLIWPSSCPRVIS